MEDARNPSPARAPREVGEEDDGAGAVVNSTFQNRDNKFPLFAAN